MPYGYIILTLWLIWAAYWIFSLRGNKRTAVRPNPAGRILYGFALIALYSLFKSDPQYFRQTVLARTDATGVTGVLLCAAGVAFSIWARRILGRNWSGSPTIKEGHELIEAGPYRYVRHPIYTGLLLAILGSGIWGGMLRDVVIFVFAFAGLWMKLRVEESLMLRQFPQAYPDYMKRTKALIPYVL